MMETTQSKQKDPGMVGIASQDYPYSKKTLLGELAIFWDLKAYLFLHLSVCIFSILFSIHFPTCWEGEFVQQSMVINSFIFMTINVWFRLDILKRNCKPRDQRIREKKHVTALRHFNKYYFNVNCRCCGIFRSSWGTWSKCCKSQSAHFKWWKSMDRQYK